MRLQSRRCLDGISKSNARLGEHLHQPAKTVVREVVSYLT